MDEKGSPQGNHKVQEVPESNASFPSNIHVLQAVQNPMPVLGQLLFEADHHYF